MHGIDPRSVSLNISRRHLENMTTMSLLVSLWFFFFSFVMVSQSEHIQTPPRKHDYYVSSSFVMRNTRGMEDHQIQIKEADGQNMSMMGNLREGNNINDLRSRGLCVVPISMLANFNGRF
ncbi:hypothetical protein F2Q70_00022706 [Brassica cretica]|uniref:Uncharacterized protein n=1 Tax=Brassica cretica TaxID=69181 RepID=A0A8S9GV27_BRACR|nr:hypothetical protein F2Q70_00022706 [Brassica cretica]